LLLVKKVKENWGCQKKNNFQRLFGLCISNPRKLSALGYQLRVFHFHLPAGIGMSRSFSTK
jgi:hypothetical protein